MSTTFYKSIVTQQCSADNATYLSSQFKYSVAVSNTKDRKRVFLTNGLTKTKETTGK